MADAAEGLMLIEAIRKEPENVPLRLIYADWLEGHGVFADTPGSLCRHYATRDAAHGALSDAAAAWAQAQARQALGLGPDAL
jgi:uncharacterized protein (TIGR02996 family)